MDSYYGAVSAKARAAILANGGSVEEGGNGFRVKVETKLIDSSDRGAWGNLSVRIWKLPNGNTLIWDSDDRELQRGYDRDHVTK